MDDDVRWAGPGRLRDSLSYLSVEQAARQQRVPRRGVGGENVDARLSPEAGALGIEGLAGLAALPFLSCVLITSASRGGPDLVVAGSAVGTSTPAAVPTSTP